MIDPYHSSTRIGEYKEILHSTHYITSTAFVIDGFDYCIAINPTADPHTDFRECVVFAAEFLLANDDPIGVTACAAIYSTLDT